MYTQQNLAMGLVLAISMVGVSYGAGGVLPGDGTSESTAYLIEDITDFDVFADQANAATYWSSSVYTKLTCDINLTGRTTATAVIASDTPDIDWGFDGISFKGIFDGNSHVVRNLTIDAAGTYNAYLGLFGRIESSGAQVKNLGVESVNITGGNGSEYIGGLCGQNLQGAITNCYADGSVTSGESAYCIGGLCGSNGDWDNSGGAITNCHAGGTVAGAGVDWSGQFGGLCGYNKQGTITNCYAANSVTGPSSLGGLCGENDDGSIINCYATGSVTGNSSLGGLCGYNRAGTITNCYATGAVACGATRYGSIGGLCGYNTMVTKVPSPTAMLQEQ